MNKSLLFLLLSGSFIGLFPNSLCGFSLLDSASANTITRNGLSYPQDQQEAANLAYDIVIVAGQSNGLGSGEGAFGDDHSYDTAIMQLGRNQDDRKLIPATDALHHWDSPFNASMAGFGTSFAREYARDLPRNRRVLIIPVAKGGSSILLWDNKEIFYTDMKARVQYALSLNRQNRIVAFLWHQGETDILNIFNKNPKMTSVKEYGIRLQKLLKSVRSDFAAGGSFPILIGDFVPGWNRENGADISGIKFDVQDIIRSTIIANPPAQFVSSYQLYSNYESGANPNPVQLIHFSGASQIEFGKRFFHVFTNQKSGPAGTLDEDLSIQIHALYQELLGRRADLAGLRHSLTQLHEHRTLAELRVQIKASLEYKNLKKDPIVDVNEQARSTVTRLMKSVLGRTPSEISADTAGLDYWVAQFKAGVTEAKITNLFQQSDEYFVRRAYESELHRRGDNSGVIFYMRRLNTKAISREQLTQEMRMVCQSHTNGECK